MKYYVDRENGDDTQDGQAPDRAWRTFANINGGSFNPDDERLLKRGSVWGEELIEPSSGYPCVPIILDAYGCGPLPVIDGEGVRDGYSIIDRSHITARNVKVIGGKNNGINLFSQVPQEGVLLEDIEVSGPRHGIWFNIPKVTLRRIHAHHCGVTSFHHGIYPSEWRLSKSLDFLVEDCICHHNGGSGISPKGGSGRIIHNHCYANGIAGGGGITISEAAAGGVTVAEKNFLHDNYSGFYMIENDAALSIELRNNVIFGELLEPDTVRPIEYQDLLFQRGAVGPYLLENNLYFRKVGEMIRWNGVAYTQAQFQAFKDASGQESLGLSDDFPLLWFAIRAGHLWK